MHLQYNFRGKYDNTLSYVVKDVVSYQLTINDPIRYYMCLTPNTGQTPQNGMDSQYWGTINTLSNFPNTVDDFLFRVGIQGNDKVDIARINELTLKTTLTTSEQDELSNLIAKHRNKLFQAEDLNAIQDSLSNLQMFFKDKVESYLNNSVTSIQSVKDSALSALENKKNNIDLYLDSTTAGALRVDLGVMSDLATTDKTSLVKAVNEVKGTTIGDLSTLATTDKTSMVKAINEIKTGAFLRSDSTITDVNLATTPGYYRLFTYTTNAPDSNSGLLVVFVIDNANYSLAQVYFSFGIMYFRTGGVKNTSSWSTWEQIETKTSIDARLSTPLSWTNLTLQNGATGVTGRIPRYTIDGKRVTIEGEILTIANGTVIATLPAGKRPPSTRIFKTALNYSTTNDGATVIVNTDGTVVIQVTGNATNQISLMGISFYVD